MNRIPLVSLLLLSTAGPTLALDLGNGVTLDGFVEAEHNDSDAGSESVIIGDVTLGWRSEGTGPWRLGAEVTIDTIRSTNTGFDETVYWGGLVLTTGLGDLTVGAARPVMDTIYSFPDVGTSELSNIGLFPIRGSLISFFPIVANDELVVGASLTGQSGALGYGVSVHEVESGGDYIRSTQIVLTYGFGATTVLGGFEDVDLSTGGSASSISLGVLHDLGALTLGAEVVDRSGAFGGTTQFVRLHGGYDVTEAFSVTANLGQVTGSGASEDLWSLSAEYRFGQGGYVQGGVTSLSSDEAIDIGLGFRF